MSDAEVELATVLRAVLARFQQNEASDIDVARAAVLGREMLELLDGPARPRWFERGETVVDGRAVRERRHRYNDRSLFRGAANPLASPMRTAVTTTADGQPAIEGRVTLGRLYEGPPKGVHGGYVAGLFDDILGGAQTLLDGATGLTGTLKVWYRNLTPLDTELVFTAWVHHVRGRRIHARATCHANGVLTAEAEALFIRVDMAALAERAAEPGS